MNPINVAVTVMPIRDNHIGFVRRDIEDSFGGLLAAPGGKVEISDGEELDNVPYWVVESAARREMLEETGVVISIQDLKFFCSLRLPNNRIVISMYCYLESVEWSSRLVFLTEEAIQTRTDFAPGMKEEALLLFEKLREEKLQ